jgi:hypothetical protein
MEVSLFTTIPRIKWPTFRIAIAFVANKTPVAILPSAEYSHRLSLKHARWLWRAVGLSGRLFAS